MKSFKIKANFRHLLPKTFRALDNFIQYAKDATAPGYELRHISVDVREGSFILLYEEEVKDVEGSGEVAGT